LTTVFILSSGRPINKAWDKTPPLSLELETNKALLEIKDNYTVLDNQMETLLNNNLTNIYIVLGYRGDEIKQYCKQKRYNVKFLVDPDWEHGSYSSARTLWEIRDVLLSSSLPIITLYHDVVLGDETVKWLLCCKADVCCVKNSQNIIKWSKRGLEELIRILGSDDKYKYNWDGLSYPVWGKIRWNNNLTWETVWYVPLFNICNDNNYKQLREKYK